MRALRFAVLGHPIAHSLSPPMHRAAFADLGLPHDYVALDTPDLAALASRLGDLREGWLHGVNITLPHKVSVLKLVDEADESALTIGVANTLVREGDRVVAHNTDIQGLADDLRAFGADAREALVIGAGGAALASVAALKRLGAGRIGVTSRSFSSPEAIAASPAAADLARLGAEIHLFRPADEGGSFAERALEASVILQATSAGMLGAAPGEGVARLIPWERVPKGALAYDLVYNPKATPFLIQAEGAGLQAIGGLGMLARQGARALGLWLNLSPDVAVMQRAAERSLFEVS